MAEESGRRRFGVLVGQHSWRLFKFAGEVIHHMLVLTVAHVVLGLLGASPHP